VVLDVDPDEATGVAAELVTLRLAAHPSAFQRGTSACTGIEFCKLALVETVARAQSITVECERRLPTPVA
jgi:sulfite reductase (ferredoxin)